MRSKFVPPGVFFCIKVGKEMRVLKLCVCVCKKKVEENEDLLREKQTFISEASCLKKTSANEYKMPISSINF